TLIFSDIAACVYVLYVYYQFHGLRAVYSFCVLLLLICILIVLWLHFVLCLCCVCVRYVFFFFSSRRRHTRLVSDWSSDVCSSDLICVRPSGGGCATTIQAAVTIAGPGDVVRIFGGQYYESVEVPPGKDGLQIRSEERRVGKECRCRWLACQYKKKNRA